MAPRAHDRLRLSAADTAWLRMDRPENRLVIHALLELDAPIAREDVEALVCERLLRERRFRSRVVPARHLGLPRLEEVPHLDPARHVRAVSLAPEDPEALARFVERRMSEPLDPGQPLWAIDVVEDHGGRGVLLVKLHHCLGDGVTLIRLLLRLTDRPAGDPPKVGVRAARGHGLAQLLRNGLGHGATLARLLALWPDPRSALRAPLGPDKRAAWSRGFSLSDVRQLAHRHGARVNDVVTAAVAGALRRELQQKGGLPRRALRALTPVFVTHRGSEALGNHFGMVFLPLPLEVPDVRARIDAVRDRTRAMKASDEATVGLVVTAALGLVSRRVERLAVSLFTSKASVMLTNVPGPTEPVQLAGRRVDGMVVWAPVSGRLGLGLSALSYADRLRLGVVADARLPLDPARLVDAFEAEMARALEPPPAEGVGRGRAGGDGRSQGSGPVPPRP